jgi:molybdate transport system ATP-binding protein
MPLLEFQCRHQFPGGFQLDARWECDRRFTALFGPSGAGKTTILSILAGFVRPQEGRVRLGNRTLLDTARGVCVPVQERAVGMVFQDALLFPHLTVEGNLRFGQRHRQHDRTARKGAVDFQRVIETLEIGGLLSRHPRNLSGGEKQRVALGRALLSGPELLLMDEPLASLDAPLKSRILAYLERVVAQWDIPTLFVTHSQVEVRRAAQWVVVLEQGRAIGAGVPEDALGQPEPLGWSNATGPMNLLRLDRVETAEGGLRGWIGPQPIVLPPQPPSATAPRFVQFSPGEVILSRQDVSGISARNHLRGRVCRIARSQQAVFVAIDIGQILWAEVTPAAAGELELEPGAEVVCLLKTHSLSCVE